MQAGGMVVYKCGEPGGAAGPSFTGQQPSNQTIILKTEQATGISVPADASAESRLPGNAAAKVEAKLKDETATGNKPLSLNASAKETAKAKSASKTKQGVKRKKRKAVKPKPSRIIHLNKPSLGTRIKSFFGL